MKKELLLVLAIIEGRGWHAIDGHKAIIEANLDNHKLSTEAFALTNVPKFNTEITWEAEKQTIRSYKLNRVPIKIECYAIDDKNNRKLLGYIILPLTSAVEGLEVDSKWYKLLGGPTTTYKTPPSLLLRLHLEAMTLDQQSGLSTNQLTAFKNGQHIHEDNKMSYLLERNKFLQNRDREQLEITMIKTNGGNQRGGNRENSKQQQAPYPPVILNPEARNGIRQDINYIDSDDMEEHDDGVEEDDEDDDELMNYDSQEDDFSDGDPNNMSGIIVEAFSLVQSNNKGSENGAEKNNPIRNKVKLNNQGIVESKEGGVGDRVSISEPTSVGAKNETPGNSKSHEKVPSEHELLMRKRNSTREHLHNLSQSLVSPNYQKEPTTCGVALATAATTTFSHDTNSPYEKRALEISHILAESCEQRNKTRKLEDGFTGESKSSSFADEEAKSLKFQLGSSSKSSSVALLLSKHVENMSKPVENTPKHVENSSLSKVKDSSCIKGASSRSKLIAHLNQKEGYFSIGPREGEVEKEFIFSFTIVYARNLSKVLSEDAILSRKEGFRFCYSLLGYSIYTDSFYNAENPEFMAEKASAIIHSSHECLSQYFLEHYFLPVYLLCGEACLGVCRVDVAQLIDIANKSEAKVEGVYEMNPVPDEGRGRLEAAPSDDSTSSKAVVAITAELTVAGNSVPAKVFSLVDSPSNMAAKSVEGIKYNEMILSDSMASASDSDEEVRVIGRRVKTSRSRFCHGCRNRSSLELEEGVCRLKAERAIEHQKKILLHEAAYEIERWKEAQQQQFLKEWTSREESLQRLIASEWSSKAKLIEGELSQRLSECDKLQEKLNSALGELSIKEEKLKLREKRVIDAEQDLKSEREKMESVKRKKATTAMQRETSSNLQQQNFLKQLQAEKQKAEQLQNEVSRLTDELATSEENFKAQTQEVICLRRKLIQSDDLIGLSKEKEALENKIESLLERKQYYKHQWQSALIDLHKIHSSHKRTIEQLTSDTKEDFCKDLLDKNSDYYSTACYKLRKLREERNTLLQTGLYPSDHSIIKNIDKKIREIRGE